MIEKEKMGKENTHLAAAAASRRAVARQKQYPSRALVRPRPRVRAEGPPSPPSGEFAPSWLPSSVASVVSGVAMGGVDGRRLCWRSGGAEVSGRPPAEAAGACGRRHHIKIMILMRDAQLKQKMRMMFGFCW